ncbi:MAG: hypothetical protein LUO93_05815, partial [Methanomicrobiales archaeon]|nr:hypothetical protein [Methanomicrobiales archaeon]
MPDPGELSGKFLIGMKLTPAQLDMLRDRILVFSVGEAQIVDSTITPDVFIEAVFNPPIPPTPPSASVNFGVNTLSGFGGAPSGQTPGSAVTGTGAEDWRIDAAGDLVPSGTYGAAKTFSVAAGGTYSLTYADASTVTVHMQAAKAHITATATDTGSVNQLLTTLLTNRGGTIVGRDCYINPHSALWRVKVPATGLSAVTITSENPATGNDGNDNPNRGGGFNLGAITFDCGLFPEASGPVPVTFDSVTFICQDDAPHANFLGYTSGAGYGISATKCLFQNADNVSFANVNVGFDNRGGSSTFNYFKRLKRGHTGGMLSGVAQTVITDNIFEAMTSDANTISGQNFSILRNHAFNFLFATGGHPDSCQHLGTTTRDLTNFGEVAYNTWVRNVGTPGTGDAQGDFFDDTISPFYIHGAHVHHEIMFLTAANCIVTTRFDGVTVNNCTILSQLNSDSPSTASAGINIAGAINSSVTDCVSNGLSVGSNTSTRNTTLARSLAAYQLALPNYVPGSNPGYVNRAAVLAAATPADLAVASGGLKNPDNTWRGALKHDGTYTDV